MKRQYRISYKQSTGTYSVEFDSCEYAETLSDAVNALVCHIAQGRPAAVYKLTKDTDDYMTDEYELVNLMDRDGDNCVWDEIEPEQQRKLIRYCH
jgi:hypothetical protein